MCPLNVAHCRVAPRLHDLNHGLVVLMEQDALRTAEEQVPQRKCWDALEPHRHISGHNFGLGCTVRHSTLLSGDSCQGEARTRTLYGQEYARRALHGVMVPGEVRIRIQMRAKLRQRVPNPAHHAQVQGMMDVAHQPVETLIAKLVPLCDAAGQGPDCTKQVEPRHACCVQDLHKDLCGEGLQGTPRAAGGGTRGGRCRGAHSTFLPSTVIGLVSVSCVAPYEGGGDLSEIRSPCELAVPSHA